MDLTLGPWKAEVSVAQTHRPLVEDMGKQAWETVKATQGFTPKEAVGGTPAAAGFTISGVLNKVVKEGSGMRVFVTFTVHLDATMVNIAPVKGDAIATGSMTPKDALLAVTEARIAKLLPMIRSGLIRKAK